MAGISLMTANAEDGLETARIIKARHPATRIITGGPHPTILPDRVLAHPGVDAVALGEGEETLQELVNRFPDFRNIAGVHYKEGGAVVRNPLRPPVADLDQLEMPAYDLLDMKRYMKSWFQMDAVSPDLKGTNIIATRGCPYACSFCQPTLDRIFGRKLRLRSPGNIVAELAHLNERYGIESFIFADDTLNIDREWLKSLCAALSASGLGLVWGCNIRANLADRAELEMMREAGLRKVFMGIESGSDRILRDVYKKGITLDQVRDAVSAVKGLGLRMQGYFMLGAPSETPAEIRSTLSLARSLPIDDATFSITTPLPGTHLYDKTRDAIRRPVETFDYYKTYVYGPSMGFTQKRLRIAKILGFALFYLSGRRLFRTFRLCFSPQGLKKLFLKLRRI